MAFISPHDSAANLRSFADRYVLDRRLGSGVFGNVWEARDSTLDHRRVALKLFQPGSEFELAAFEARLTERLRSPKVVPVFDAGIHADVPFMVSQVAPLGSVEDHVPPCGLEPEYAVDLARQIAIAVSLCHKRGIVHRDIKPSNVFLFSHDEAKLGDFGVCAEVGEFGVAAANGDPIIRPPEAYLFNRMDRRSDVYQVGLCLYHMLAGVNPFGGSSLDIDAIVDGRIPDICDISPHVPLDLAKRVRQAIHRDPDKRFQTADDMHAALALPPRSSRWQPIAPDPEVTRQWQRIGRGTPATIRQFSEGTRHAIDVRYSTSGRLIVSRSDLTQKQVLVELRRLFRELRL